jgi:RimJ/RimL family protein N-acetyltransferase
MKLRVLLPGDEALLERFLVARGETSLFLRSNVRAAGLEDAGQPLQGTYVGAFEGGELFAVVAHAWNGNLLLQAPVMGAELCREAVACSGRALSGLIGPWEQIEQVRAQLGLQGRATKVDSKEPLFRVALSALKVPALLGAPGVEVGLATEADLPLVASWRKQHLIEGFNEPDREGLLERARREMENVLSRRALFVLRHGGEVRATCGFTAQVPDCVQVGGVWTPAEHRSRGYGRAVVAGALRLAGAGGVTTAVLFTGEDNVPAQRAYAALGFERIGDYGLVFFA